MFIIVKCLKIRTLNHIINIQKYIKLYCNDRSGEGYASSGEMYYAVYKRLNENKRPTYKCGGSHASVGLYKDANIADKFNVSGLNGGNGQLEYPVGLMTADEVSFAGGKYFLITPNTYYYNNSNKGAVTGTKYWWTMTPYGRVNNYSYVFSVDSNQSNPGKLVGNSLNDNGTLRPIISLTPEAIVMSGIGTSDQPYEVSL